MTEWTEWSAAVGGFIASKTARHKKRSYGGVGKTKQGGLKQQPPQQQPHWAVTHRVAVAEGATKEKVGVSSGGQGTPK